MFIDQCLQSFIRGAIDTDKFHLSIRPAYYRIVKKFDFDESLTVDFRDIFEGPAAVQAVPMSFLRGVTGLRGVMRNGVNKSFDENFDGNGINDVESAEGERLNRRSGPKQGMMELI